jgi:alpha-glucoside transport system substrate-binding protein
MELGMVGGQWLGLPVKSDVMSMIWYSPTKFQSFGYSVPNTWDELDALVNRMAADGNVPWSMGIESGDATGWPATYFIEDILLVQEGPTYVKGILDGSIPYNDTGVMQAYTTYGKWAKSPYALDGADGTLTTNFMDAIYKPFGDSPAAMMVKQLSFAGDQIQGQFPNLKYGTDYDFFITPGIQGMQGYSDWLLAFSDKPAVRALVIYLSSPEGGVNWAKGSFGLSPNRNAEGNYVDPILMKKAVAFYNPQGVVPHIGDTIPGAFATAEWTAIIDYLKGGDLNDILSRVAEAQAAALNR